MSTVNLTCHHCQKAFECPLKEYNRHKTRKRFFCSLSCGTKWRNIHDKEIRKKMAETAKESMKGNSFARKGYFTYYLYKAKNRGRFCDLDEQFLQELWKKQGGLCAITGVPIHFKKGRCKPNTASIDRIDNTKDYTKDNVQFLAYSINLAKNSFTDQEIISLIQKIRSPSSRVPF